jgi:hypothetical protein
VGAPDVDDACVAAGDKDGDVFQWWRVESGEWKVEGGGREG